ncbi:MAG TPA: hypothetical protein VFT22_05995 [Kofleriaceae bacterium]|nr:hypothetical protein [Kofleriaceae bacterium]
MTTVSNRAFAAAIAWHAILFIVLICLAQGWRPSRRLARRALSLPLVSVAGFALVSGNPFNATVFAGAALALDALARRPDPRPVSRTTAWRCLAGVALLAYGWVYPHFLDAPLLLYLIAAPVGLVPCPTLAVAIGLALIGDLLTRGWGIALAALGLCYGLFGVARLGVLLDLGLVAGAIALAAASLAPVPPLTRSGRSSR